jgi:fucose 4-O-acetylase-like acetyltransferase
MQTVEMQTRALLGAELDSCRARNRTMDILKAFGIISIVLAHATPPGIVVEVVQIYYIAIFFFVSGYLFKPEYFSDLGVLFRRRLLPLYTVFVAWNLSYLVYEIGLVTPVLRRLGVDLGPDHEILYAPRAAAAIVLKGSSYSMGGALWFITSLITATALFGLIGAIAQRLPERASWVFIRGAVLACFFVGFVEGTTLRWPDHADTALVGLLVLYAGYRYPHSGRPAPGPHRPSSPRAPRT